LDTDLYVTQVGFYMMILDKDKAWHCLILKIMDD